LTPSHKRELATDLMSRYGASMRKACAAIELSRVVYLYRSVARDNAALVTRMKEITRTRVHYGYRRVHVMLKREGFKDNHKRVYRLYREHGLALRHKRPKRNKAAQLRQPKMLAQQVNQIWSMDFVADNLFDGRKLRMLTVVDCYSRESLAIHVGQSLKGEDVAGVLNAIARQRGQPQTIKTDNGSEFISKVMDKWAYERGVELDFSRPGKPTDNAMVESFNGRLRQECLNEHWFMSLADAQAKIEAWRRFYNEVRPHSALDWRAPAEFARQTGPRPGLSRHQEPEIPTSER
jgi:putative transposase